MGDMNGPARIVGALAAVALIGGVLGRSELLVAQRAGNADPHYRVLTVYDAATHHAIDSVQVVDLLAAKFGLPNGRAFTNDSGRVLLAFLRQQHDSAVIQVAKPGYEERRLVVMVSPADTGSLSLALTRTSADARVASPVTTSKRHFAVFDSASKQALEGVEVADVLGAATAFTDAKGAATVAVSFTGAKAMVTLRKVGYAPATLVIDAGDSISTMKQALVRLVDLAAITATAQRTSVISRFMEGFDQRRKVGLGKFVTREELRKEDGRTLIDALAVHGILKFHRGCMGALIYIDGVPQGSGWVDNPRNPPWPGTETDQYDGVEFYASSLLAPAEFSGGGSSCGVLLLWTRKQ
jgi:hypothetical protein